MPTGYTADIAKGISFEQFILGCARAFGALITMRDAAPGTEIPDEFKPSDYHDKELVKARQRVADLVALTPKQIGQRAKAFHKKAMASYRASLEKDQAAHERYADMLAKARNWEPPTKEHTGLKDFMVKQITKSIEWDCDLDRKSPEEPTAEAWYAEQIGSAQWYVDYHAKGAREERERCASRTKWVQQLRASL